MASIYWKGGAPAVAQVQSYLFGATWEADDLIRVTIGTATYDFTAGSTTIATIIDNLVTTWTALDAAVYPQFAEITPTRSTSTLVLTAVTAGKPFVCTLTPLESDGSGSGAQEIEGGTTATTGTASTANKGPNDWATAANWSAGAVPVGADTVTVNSSEWPIYYGLGQSGVTLADLRINAEYIGLPEVNEDGAAYPEYRDTFLAIGATLCTIGVGADSDRVGTARRVKINFGSVATTTTIARTGTGVDESLEAVLLRGTSGSNVFNISGDSEVGIAVQDTETSTYTTLRITGPARVRCGAGVTNTTIVNNGGELELNSAIGTSLTQDGGSTVINGTGAVAQLTANAATIVYNTSGSLGGNTALSGGAVLDASQDTRTFTLTNPIDCHSGASVIDPFKRMGTGLIVDFNKMTADVSGWGADLRVQRTAVA